LVAKLGDASSGPDGVELVKEAIERAVEWVAIRALLSFFKLFTTFILHWLAICSYLDGEAGRITHFFNAIFLVVDFKVDLGSVRDVVVLQIFKLKELQKVSHLSVMS